MKLIFAFLAALVFSAIATSQSPEINIIPKPSQMRMVPTGSYELDRDTRIVANSAASKRVASVLNLILSERYGFTLKTVSKAPRRNAIVIEEYGPAPGVAPNAERYMLTIEPERIRLMGEERGLFYGVHSLVQLLAPDAKRSSKIPALEIIDEPRFRYRGMHLDVGRHFMPVSFVKKYIDLISQYKFNYLHLGLTQDQGWRVESKKYPRLTEVGGCRKETVKERNLSPYIGDGIPHCGYFTQDDIREILAHAKTRYVTVIPEINVPGHSAAALAAYPQYGCKQNYEYKVQTTWGIFKEVYCPTEETFKFLEDVFGELIALFPDTPYIHIGGDEVLKDHWKESAFVQELKQRENLKDEHEVQSYFVRRMEKFINAKGKKIIGWDEILEGGLAPNATVMSWRGMKGGIEAAKAKHDVIMTPTDNVYFDYGQGDPAYEPLNIGSYVPLSKVYSFDPVPKDLTPDEAKYVIGGQGNVWTEYIKTPSHLEYMAFPRAIALSEVLWSRPQAKDYADFTRRLNTHLPWLDKQNVNYRIPEPGGLKNIVTESEKVLIELQPSPGTRVLYTTDGSTPDERSPAYTAPIELQLKDGERRELKTIVVTPNGRKSVVYGATIVRGKMAEPTVLAEKKQGVNFILIRGDENAGSSKMTGETRSIQLNQFSKTADLKQPFSVTFDGYLDIPADGIYELQIDSTWNASLDLNGQRLIDDTAGTKDSKKRYVILPLKAGLHKITLRYDHRGGDLNFRFRYGIKGQGLRQAYGGEFVH